MFARSRNLYVSGGTFTDHHIENLNVVNGPRGIDRLLGASAAGAFHNSGERFDPPRCHPNTRTTILAELMDWVIGKVGWDGLIMWLYGPAGAGKSAIAQSFAEHCQACGLLLASFFFSRTDPKRNTEKSLIASLAYQTALNIPHARNPIEAAVENDPAIFQRSIEEQFAKLILEPLTQLSETSSIPVPNLIIIDGLDECRNPEVQRHILDSISGAVQPIPLKFLICSRPEPHLRLQFATSPLKGMMNRLALDDGYQPDDDIEHYLQDSFTKILATHPLREYIPSTWPSPEVIDTLIEKSSGQFIYAATVVKFVSSYRHQPASRLKIILGLRPHRNSTPFAELDALYTNILSSIEEVQETLRLLGIIIFSDMEEKTPDDLAELLFIDPGEIRCLLLNLGSVLECKKRDGNIKMLHASFPDFLLDQSRSGPYYIHSPSIHADIAQLYLRHIQLHQDCENCFAGASRWCCNMVLNWSFNYLSDQLEEAEPTADLRQAILDTCYITSLFMFDGLLTFDGHCGFDDLLSSFLSFLKTSNFTNPEELYFHHRDIFDGMLCRRLADSPLNLGLVVYLALMSELDYGDWPINLHDCFPEHVDRRIARRWFTLCLDPRCVGRPTGKGYLTLLKDFLADPSRAGTYVLDGTKYAMVATFLVDFFIQPSAYQVFLEFDHSYNNILELIDCMRTFLSRASFSDELILRISRSNLIFITSQQIDQHAKAQGFVELLDPQMYKDKLQPLVEEIGDYLMRVCGRVPSGLRIMLDGGEEGGEQSYYYNKA